MKPLILATLSIAAAIFLPACSSDDEMTTTTTTTEETVHRPVTTGVTQTTTMRSY